MSESSFFRRDPKDERSDFWHTVRVGCAMLAMALLLIQTPTWAFRWLYINVQSVSIPDHVAGDDPDVTVYRYIQRDFWGGYVVMLREAGTHRFVCSTPAPDWFLYREDANATQPLVLHLSDWLDDETALQDCEDRGFGEGDFYAVTCHVTNALGFIPARRCVDSNVFHRSAR